ncbi:hypothetical protein WICPIJ_001470 [Wickerhamomyces pijperi]|uniref:Uncharacterized protein n=1 Tax=Wickerhamomyces pijperi TaxID=599730 RepID=A0A9P8QAV8_WICPI|nr:hypothetical protein WICPIJ_001470 [Wickerhamomyces pijperi]
MVPLLSDMSPLGIHKVCLVPQEVVDRCDNVVQERQFRYTLPLLSFGVIMVVQSTFEDETETLWQKSNLISFTPYQKIKTDLFNLLFGCQFIHLGLPFVISDLEVNVPL